jgi:Mg-chelatase subunit ChlD
MYFAPLRRGPWLGLALAAALSTPPASAAPDSVTIAFALDTSGSITREELQQARVLITSIFEGLPPGSEAALFTFDDTERLLLPWTSTPTDLQRTLDIVGPTGRFTALHDALYEASRKLHDTRTARKAMVLVTDGKDEGSTLTLEDGLRVAQDSRFPVWVVGVGHVQEKVLRRIAKLTTGEYVALKAASGPAVAAKIVSVLPPPEAPVAASAAAPAGPAAVVVAPGTPAGSAGGRPPVPAGHE